VADWFSLSIRFNLPSDIAKISSKVTLKVNNFIHKQFIFQYFYKQ